jgi:hypothetical protein
LNEQNAEICATYLDYETVDKEMNKTVEISQLKKEIYKLQREGARLAERIIASTNFKTRCKT